MALKPRHAKFVAEYLKTSNATQAYLAAGYKTTPAAARRSASELLTRPDIEQAIQRARDEAAKAAELNAEWVLTRLKKVAERCLQEEAVLDREGNPTGEFRFDASGAAKALELIGKTHAMFVDRLKVSEESELPDDELDARIGALTQTGREAPASTATH